MVETAEIEACRKWQEGKLQNLRAHFEYYDEEFHRALSHGVEGTVFNHPALTDVATWDDKDVHHFMYVRVHLLAYLETLRRLGIDLPSWATQILQTQMPSMESEV